MRRLTQPSTDRKCQKCVGEIPSHKRVDAAYCSQRCRKAVEKRRYRERHPDYVERQKRLVQEWHHRKNFGHTEFIDDPIHYTKPEVMPYAD